MEKTKKEIKFISVSRTHLPPLEDYVSKLKIIWENNWLTNNGDLVQELEERLKKYWGVKHVVCVCNGTSAIQIALRILKIKEVYTSPFSFIATCAAPAWLGIKLRFVDEGGEYPKNKPALVTHVYGKPNYNCGKPTIYDASHAFGVKVDGKSIMHWGDVSVVSFNAVKIFQTAEGGAVVTNNDAIAKKARWMRNYGFKTRYSFYGVGTNYKMSEFHAAMGLCSLKLIPKILKRYARLIKRYNKALNYFHEDLTYYPVFYPSERKLLKAIEVFEKNHIYPRRYFYPPLNKVFGGKKCPAAERTMSQVLCLPLYHDLTFKDQDLVIKIAKETGVF